MAAVNVKLLGTHMLPTIVLLRRLLQAINPYCLHMGCPAVSRRDRQADRQTLYHYIDPAAYYVSSDNKEQSMVHSR